MTSNRNGRSERYPNTLPFFHGLLSLSKISLLLLQLNSHDGDGIALCGPLAVIQVVEVATQALAEDVGATKSKRSVRTEREAGGKNSFRLRRPIELELEVGCNTASASLGILEDVVFKGDCELTFSIASKYLITCWGSRRCCRSCSCNKLGVSGF